MPATSVLSLAHASNSKRSRTARTPTRKPACIASIVGAMLGLCLGSSIASATPVSDFSFFGADSVVLDFNEIAMAPGTVVTDQLAGLGVSFSPNVWFENNRAAVGWDDHNIANFLTGTSISNPVVEFIFSGSVDGAALEFAGNAGNDFLFEAILSGSVVESFVHAQAGCCAAQVLGFQEIEFDTLRITHQTGGSTFFIGDRLSFHVVPEPGTAALIGLGLVGLSGTARRRRLSRSVDAPGSDSR